MKTKSYLTTDEGKQWIGYEEIRVEPLLPPGIYTIGYDDRPEFYTAPAPNSRIHLDDDQRSVLERVRKFWDSADKYASLGFPHKRGVLLYGPPGTGKTTCMRAVCLDTVAHGGYVLLLSMTHVLKLCVESIRETAPKAPIVIAIEDLDNYSAQDEDGLPIVGHNRGAESQLLDALDGSFRADHVLWIATTNNRKGLSERLTRPSRFDMQIEIGFPTPDVRRHYIASVLPSRKDLWDKLVEQSDGMSIAEIKETIIQRVVYAGAGV